MRAAEYAVSRPMLLQRSDPAWDLVCAFVQHKYNGGAWLVRDMASRWGQSIRPADGAPTGRTCYVVGFGSGAPPMILVMDTGLAVDMWQRVFAIVNVDRNRCANGAVKRCLGRSRRANDNQRRQWVVGAEPVLGSADCRRISHRF